MNMHSTFILFPGNGALLPRVKRVAISAVILSLLFGLAFQLPMRADLKADLTDDYLKGEYDWAMFLNVQDVDHYLNYSGSKLHPLTKVRVYFNTYQRRSQSGSGSATAVTAPAKLYEELWYYQGKPVGLRRRNQLNIAPDSSGALVVGQSDGAPEHSLALANALVRLALELQFQHIVTSVVMVPQETYDAITADLGYYRFYNDIAAGAGVQMSIHTRSYPQQKDEYYYLRK
jgi:hypothetical protein